MSPSKEINFVSIALKGFNKMKPTLYLIRGVCGSGKSTFANTLYESGVVEWTFEADKYFEGANGGYNFDATKLHVAHRNCQELTALWLSKGDSVAVSNTSTREREVEVYWQDENLTLELDHINGNSCDNRLENLRFLCPNCHSQTDTYKGRNIKWIK